MLDRLEDSFKRLSQFSADLAHELRTPVNNLRGEAGVALSQARTAGRIPPDAGIEPGGICATGPPD